MHHRPPLSRTLRKLLREEAGVSFMECALLGSLLLVVGMLMVLALRTGSCI